jgi:hypothetical protein
LSRPEAPRLAGGDGRCREAGDAHLLARGPLGQAHLHLAGEAGRLGRQDQVDRPQAGAFRAEALAERVAGGKHHRLRGHERGRVVGHRGGRSQPAGEAGAQGAGAEGQQQQEDDSAGPEARAAFAPRRGGGPFRHVLTAGAAGARESLRAL